LKNNGQKMFEKITVKKYLKNNGQKLFEKQKDRQTNKQNANDKILFSFEKRNQKLCSAKSRCVCINIMQCERDKLSILHIMTFNSHCKNVQENI